MGVGPVARSSSVFLFFERLSPGDIPSPALDPGRSHPGGYSFTFPVLVGCVPGVSLGLFSKRVVEATSGVSPAHDTPTLDGLFFFPFDVMACL